MKIVVLHGWGQNRKVWVEFASRFEPNEVIAIDLPGFGDEPLVSDDWGIPEYASWVMSKISKMNLNDVILLGHSFGGRISTFIASEQPEWLRALILTGSPSIYRPTLITKLKIKKYKVLKWISNKLNLKPQKISVDLTDADKRGLGKIFRKVVPFDQTELLKKINTPTLLLWGENDEPVPLRIAYEINQLINNSKLEIIQNTGHQVVQESPFLSYGIIKKFIESL